jgi:membrane fusion protein (multidrug efflux system)
MLRNRISALLSVIAVAAAVTMFIGCGGESKGATTAEAAPGVTVRVETVAPTPLMDAISVAGIVKAADDVMLSPEEGGVVKAWKAKKGERVSKGQIIAILKDEVIKASYDAAVAQYEMADLNYTKQQKVYEEQGISDLQYQNLRLGRDAAKANADLMKARWERTQIKSPVDGMLDEQYFDEGEFSPPGVPIAHLVNLDVLKISAEIPERHAGSIASGAMMLVTFDAFPQDTLRARITFVGSTVNPSNRALTVEGVLPNHRGRLKPEMIGKVLVLRSSKDRALLVPEIAVQLVDRNRYVVFVENGGKAEQREVALGAREGNRVEVLRGLRVGDRLIVTDLQKLTDGTAVRVAE